MIVPIVFHYILPALLAAGFTWALAWWFYTRRIAPQLQTTLEQIQAEFEQRVKRGVLAAGEELLPHLREQVRLGFQDALKQTQTGEMVESYASVVNKGADLIANSVGALFGIKPKK